MNQMNRVNSGNDFGGDNSTINIVVVIIIIIITKMQPVATDVARSVVCVFCTQGHCAVTDETDRQQVWDADLCCVGQREHALDGSKFPTKALYRGSKKELCKKC